MLSPELAITLGLAGIGGLIWFVRLEGRVDKNEALHVELRGHVEYIRDRIDDALQK